MSVAPIFVQIRSLGADFGAMFWTQRSLRFVVFSSSSPPALLKRTASADGSAVRLAMCRQSSLLRNCQSRVRPGKGCSWCNRLDLRRRNRCSKSRTGLAELGQGCEPTKWDSSQSFEPLVPLLPKPEPSVSMSRAIPPYRRGETPRNHDQ